MEMVLYILRWLIVLLAAALCGKLVSKIKLPAILGWLMAGMFLGPYALNILPQALLDSGLYKVIMCWMQCSFGIMLGTELSFKKLKEYGKALTITTLTQSLGTFLIVSLAFAILFHFQGIPEWLGLAFGGIALATAPAPALSITREFHTRGPVTDTLLPMAVMDDVVGIAVFFTVDSVIAKIVSGGAMPLYMIPVMIFTPILVGALIGIPMAKYMKKHPAKKQSLTALVLGVTIVTAVGILLNKTIFASLSLNYTLMGVSFSAACANIVSERQLDEINRWYSPILNVSLLTSIVDLGAPLDYHMIAGAGLYTLMYIVFRAVGKYFGARFGATITHMPETVQKYLGLTLLPHSGVSLVFTGIICTTLASRQDLVGIVQGTIAAAAIINEFIAVIAARKGFELAGEMNGGHMSDKEMLSGD